MQIFWNDTKSKNKPKTSIDYQKYELKKLRLCKEIISELMMKLEATLQKLIASYYMLDERTFRYIMQNETTN